MKSKLGNPTKAEKKKIQICTQEIGCVPCLLKGLGFNPADWHHVLRGGRRVNHSHGFANCPLHHRNIIPSGYTEKQVKEVMGPSMAANPKEFEEEFGTQEELVEIQNILYNKYLELSGE